MLLLQVITIEGSEVFKLKTVLYNKATKGIKRYSSMENVDTRVTLDVNSIRFVFLYRYVRQLIVSFHFHNFIVFIVLHFETVFLFLDGDIVLPFYKYEIMHVLSCMALNIVITLLNVIEFD